MADEFDPFKGGTGLKEGVATISDAWFANDPAYNNGQTLLMHITKEWEDGDPTTDMYSCGSLWNTHDSGKTAEHPRGDKQLFNGNTAYSQLVKAAFEAGAEDVLRERSKKLENRGPMHAEMWKGLRFKWGIDENKWKDRETKEERVSYKSVPEKYLGEGAGKPSAGSASRPAPATDTTSASSNGGSGALEGVPKPLAAKVKVLAGKHEYGAWVDEVLNLDGATDHDKLVAALADEGLYSDLRSG